MPYSARSFAADVVSLVLDVRTGRKPTALAYQEIERASARYVNQDDTWADGHPLAEATRAPECPA